MVPMNSDYYKTSLEIVKEFIQTITIVDDKAQFIRHSAFGKGKAPFTIQEEGASFDAGRITKQFAEDGKICSVYRFTEKEDVKKIVKIALKSDVIILDWKIEISEKELSENDELEEEVVRSKGFYTLEILKEIIKSEHNSLKVIVIYTDEPAFVRIVNEIQKAFEGKNIKDGNSDEPFSLYYNSNKITLFGKEELKGKTTHLKDIAQRSYSYEELPGAIYEEFVRFTYGVVSGIFLKAIASIRTNTYLLFSTFKRDIDAAFIAHKGLLPIPDDAYDHIVELIGSEMKSVINGALDDTTMNRLIDSYIDSLDETLLFEYKDKDGVKKKFSTDEFKSLINDPNGKNSLSKASKSVLHEELPKSLIKAYNSSLPLKEVEDKAYKSNCEFARLTTLKKRYPGLNYNPFLTLGVLLKSKDISEKDEYWICIQPKCDSVRICEEERSFLFLSLSEESKNREIMLDVNTGFKINYSVIKAKQFLFKPTDNNVVKVQGEPDDWFFEDSSQKRFEYLCELKNDFAQSIANEFAARLSRVALNQSEWLRLNAKK